jgi:hypothetical protein
MVVGGRKGVAFNIAYQPAAVLAVSVILTAELGMSGGRPPS